MEVGAAKPKTTDAGIAVFTRLDLPFAGLGINSKGYVGKINIGVWILEIG